MKAIEKLMSMSQNTSNIANKIEILNIKIGMLQDEIDMLNDGLKESILNNPDFSKVEKLAVYLKFKEYPTEIYDTNSYDRGEYDSFEDITIKVCWGWGYTDVMGLSEEEFKELNAIMNGKEA